MCGFTLFPHLIWASVLLVSQQRISTPRGFGPGPKSASRYGPPPPFADLDPPTKLSFWHRLYHMWYLILFESFLSTFFSFTTQHSSAKIKINSHFVPILPHLASRTVYARIKCEETTAFELLKLLKFSRRDQNALDLRKFCAYKRDNAVWNYFRTHFQDNLVHFFFLFGVFGKIYRFIYAVFPKGNNRWQTPDPRF